MKWLWGVTLLAVTLAYWVSLTPSEQTLAPWALRKSLLYYAGVMAMVMMSVGMVLSLRTPWLENLTGGLDRNYRLHKWVGISGMVFALLHWFIKVEPKSLVQQGWVSAQIFETPSGIADFFADPNPFVALKSVAKTAGEWSIYILAALVLIALLKWIPYRRFFKTHRIMPVVYLVLVFHSVVLFGKLGWASPVGVLTGLLMAIGSVAAILSLTRRIGARRRFQGEVVQHVEHQSDGVTQIDIKMHDDWPGHLPGQFAFLTLDPKEGGHPFSIASEHSLGENVVRFYIKHLGDYTNTLAQAVHTGQLAIIEGPYGRFSFKPAQARQIWIAGGVGVTPFISELEHLVNQNDAVPEIDLYLCVRDDSASLTKRALQLAAKVGVRAHVIASGSGNTLNAQRILEAHPDWKDAHFWFCGPSGLGQAIRQPLVKLGLPASHFHQELFEMR
ncbi:ferredoxin reductase family protein [Orrella marina]|uniref:Ferric reductase n=1 Tax=Orrella marina TaxID=2163011 RepID=A0A2R4XNV1_9BURK|nr:ferric reductase-like transmembrane domain-containing protein [Orrella marina]AWB35438.1 ferric reductase [Orrella marina]